MSTTSFQAWGLVEIMGHAQLAGRLSEEVIAGANLLRIDVPQNIPGEAEFRTEYVGPNSIYRLRITTEQVARELAARGQSEPGYAYGLRMQSPALAAPTERDPNDVNEDDIPL